MYVTCMYNETVTYIKYNLYDMYMYVHNIFSLILMFLKEEVYEIRSDKRNLGMIAKFIQISSDARKHKNDR